MKKLLFIVLACGTHVNSSAQIETLKTDITKQDKWSLTANKLKTTTGRLLLNNPPGSIWVIYVYRMADNKFITSANQSNNKGLIVLPPGEYKITINTAPVLNVPIKKGHDTKLETGLLDVTDNDVWYLYDETGKTYVASGNKPEKLLMPAGNYTLKVGGQGRTVMVKNSNDENEESDIIDREQYTMAPLKDTANYLNHTMGLLWLIPNQQTFSHQLNLTIAVYKAGQGQSGGEPIFYCDNTFSGPQRCKENTALPEGDYDIAIGANYSNINYESYDPCFSRWNKLVLKNIKVRKGYETKLKYGYLQHSSTQPGIFQIFDISGQTSYHLYMQHGSGLPYPVGRYVVKQYFVGEFPVEITDGKTTYFNSIDSTYLATPKWTTGLTGSKDPLVKNLGRLNTFFPNPVYPSFPDRNFVFLQIPNPNNATDYTLINLDTIKYKDLKPGRYKLFLNSVQVEVTIVTGKEKTLKYGNLQIKPGTQRSWRISSLSNHGYRSGQEERIIALPIGYYKLTIELKTFLIKISESSTLLFNYTCLFKD